MAYVDISTLMTIAPGEPLPAAVVQQIRDNQEFLIDPPACSVYNTAAQSVPTGTNTALTADSETYDNDSMHSTASNTHRITAQTAGRYLFFASVEFAASTGGHYRDLLFVTSGSASFGRTMLPQVNSGSIATLVVSVGTRVLTVGEWVQVMVRHNAGVNLNVTLREFTALFLTR